MPCRNTKAPLHNMWRPYRLAVQRVLPHAKLVVDKFHVVSKANASLDAVRRSIGKTDIKKQGAGLKKAHKLFAKRAADLRRAIPDRLWVG